MPKVTAKASTGTAATFKSTNILFICEMLLQPKA